MICSFCYEDRALTIRAPETQATGRIIRDDAEDPHETIVMLGRVVRACECQWCES